jgi:hypothetical protein
MGLPVDFDSRNSGAHSHGMQATLEMLYLCQVDVCVCFAEMRAAG